MVKRSRSDISEDGFVPDSRLWRLVLVTLGAMIAFGAGWLWARDSMNEYRELD